MGATRGGSRCGGNVSRRRRRLPATLLAVVGVMAAVAGLSSAQAGASSPAALKASVGTSWPNGPDPCAIPCGTLTDSQIMGLIGLMSVTEEDTLIHLGGPNVNGNAGSVASVERLGIPPWHWTDGPAGVRLGSQETAMPNPASLISSWDQSMGNLYGHTVALDARATTQDGWYAPMMNQVTIPTAGRNFETSGEDPYLAGQMVVGEVQGAQGSGFVTELKHYVDNDFENSRTSTSVYVDERTLHEGEMQAFEAGIHAGARAVMCSYNRLNIFVTPPAAGQGDIYACSNNYTLNQVLKGRLPFNYSQLAVPPSLGFTGNVGSDYGATHVPSDLINGLDTEQSTSSSLGEPVRTASGTCSAGNAIPCNGPGTAAVAATADFPAVPAYTADQWKMALDNAAFHALQMYNAAGYLEGTPYGTMHQPNCIPANLANGATADCADVQPTRSTVAALDPTSRAAAQTVAEKGAVLLKNNNGILPLKCSDFTGNGVLVMGPTAFAPYTGGGGSAHVTPKPNVQSPYDALVAAATAKCGGTPVIKSTFGSLTSATIDGWPVPTHGGSATDPSSNPGLLRTQASAGTVVAPGAAVTPCTAGAGCIAPSDDQTVNYTDPNNAVLAPGTGLGVAGQRHRPGRRRSVGAARLLRQQRGQRHQRRDPAVREHRPVRRRSGRHRPRDQRHLGLRRPERRGPDRPVPQPGRRQAERHGNRCGHGHRRRLEGLHRAARDLQRHQPAASAAGVGADHRQHRHGHGGADLDLPDRGHRGRRHHGRRRQQGAGLRL